MIYKIFSKIFTNYSTKYVYSINNNEIKHVKNFDILKIKQGDVFVNVNNKSLIKYIPKKLLINATEELQRGNMCIIYIISKNEIHLDILN